MGMACEDGSVIESTPLAFSFSMFEKLFLVFLESSPEDGESLKFLDCEDLPEFTELWASPMSTYFPKLL
jgi:hypothetical protein